MFLNTGSIDFELRLIDSRPKRLTGKVQSAIVLQKCKEYFL